MERLLFKLPSDIKARFMALCEKRGLSMAAYLRLLVTDELEKTKG